MVCLALLALSQVKAQEAPQPQKALPILDLSEHDFMKREAFLFDEQGVFIFANQRVFNGRINLGRDAEWELWPNKLLEPGTLGFEAPAHGLLTRAWEFIAGDGGAFSPRPGVLTARLRLRLAADAGDIEALFSARQPTRIFMDGREVVKVGTVGEQGVEIDNQQLVTLVNIPADGQIHEMVVQASYHGLGRPYLSIGTISTLPREIQIRIQDNALWTYWIVILLTGLLAATTLLMMAKTGDVGPGSLLVASSLSSISAWLVSALHSTYGPYFNFSYDASWRWFVVSIVLSGIFTITALQAFLRLRNAGRLIFLSSALLALVGAVNFVFPRTLSALIHARPASPFYNMEYQVALIGLFAILVAALRQRHRSHVLLRPFFCRRGLRVLPRADDPPYDIDR